MSVDSIYKIWGIQCSSAMGIVNRMCKDPGLHHPPSSWARVTDGDASEGTEWVPADAVPTKVCEARFRVVHKTKGDPRQFTAKIAG
eukprot:CAMPEP_0170167768 /NCGR_PEP_ID=MMETSP0040_2-20121228/1078_1 /TAXON_ID=641309 /ORGANISM="Lotharella oceanica, Strain CCMP622" /LENGTH=85 /DNA_ID=CAMNT_0010405893 /DNA_START=522 /DNA_END=780 /DNA_ORIENTATION=-